MALRVVEQDILLSSACSLAHQCNCTSSRAAGVARSIFDRYPRANTYRTSELRTPGTVTASKADGEPTIINMYAQLAPGRPRRAGDSAAKRLLWFRECLTAMQELPDLQSVAFPYLIGCGLAGGAWEAYEEELRRLAAARPDIEVTLCRLPPVAPAPVREADCSGHHEHAAPPRYVRRRSE